MDRRLIEILLVNKKLYTRDEIAGFRTGMKELLKQDLDDSLLPELLLAFDDGAHNSEILEELINFVFEFNAQTLADALTRMTQELSVSSPRWLKMLYSRSLHNEDIRSCIRKNLISLPKEEQQSIRDFLMSITIRKDKFEDPEVTKDIQEKVSSILDYT